MCNLSLTNHKIYLIHGYANPRFMMFRLAGSLKKENLPVQNYSYKSISSNLDSIGRKLYEDIKKENLDSVSFVTHSMGALVVRSMYQFSQQDLDFPIIFRMVMIAPPNKGAERADFYSSFKIMRKILGPNVELMRTDSNSYANRLPKPDEAEIGIIIGCRGKKAGFNS